MFVMLFIAGLRLCFREQTVEVERAREHSKSAIGDPRSLVARTVPVKLDTVFVRIAEIKRFADAVVGRAV